MTVKWCFLVFLFNFIHGTKRNHTSGLCARHRYRGDGQSPSRRSQYNNMIYSYARIISFVLNITVQYGALTLTARNRIIYIMHIDTINLIYVYSHRCCDFCLKYCYTFIVIVYHV